MKKILVLALVCVMTAGLLLTGCGGETAADSGLKQLAVQIGPNPETIDPALNVTVDGGTMILHAFEPLLTISENNEVQPGQAETWEVSDDGLIWTFHLRDGLKWSDGSDLTAEDFVYSWKRVAAPATAAPYSDTALDMVKGFEEALAGDPDALAVSAPDASTFVVELTRPCPYFDKLAAFVALCPVQQATVEANGDAWAVNPEKYISNGAFRMKELESGSHITFEKNPNYWNAEAVKLDEIVFRLIEDSAASYSAFQTGEVLLAKTVPTEEIPNMAPATEGGSFHTDPVLGTYFLIFNMNEAPYQDSRVREALNIVLDREYLTSILMQGTYTAAGNLVGPGLSDAEGQFISNANGGHPYLELTESEANLEKARELLAEAGYPEGEGFPEIHYLINDSGYNREVAEYLQATWDALGLRVSVDSMEWSSFTSQRRAGEFDIARSGWLCDYDNPTTLLDTFVSSNGNNDGSYSNPSFDAAMERADNAELNAERFAAMHEAEDILMADYALIPLAYYNDFWVQSDKLVNVGHTPYGHFQFHFADIAE